MNEDHKTKKQRLGSPSEDMFPSVGDQAENVDNGPGVIEAKDIPTTGATDALGRPVQEIESLCMNCHEQGTTRMLFTSIPRFREVVVMSFECPHCGFKSAEVQNAAEIQERGGHTTVKLQEPADISRQVVKSEHATVRFPELDVEIPPGSGRVTTIEGLLAGMRDDLEHDQPIRRAVDPALYEKVEEVRSKLEKALEGQTLPMTFILDDPSGNSFVMYEPQEQSSGKWVHKEYYRTPTQSRQIGLAVPTDEDHRNASVATQIAESAANDTEFDTGVPAEMRDEVQTFDGVCPSCHSPAPTKMKMVNIPHFRDVIIMSTTCSECGFKNNEVKTGGAVPDHGRKITLKVVEPEDLSRDILKSETCTLRFPELDLDLAAGTLGGRFTTIEGLLKQVYEELETKVFERDADSMDEETKRRWAAFLARLQTAIDGVLPFVVHMEDPLAASYIQNVYAPDPDPNMEIEDYTRTEEENEELGITDMAV